MVLETDSFQLNVAYAIQHLVSCICILHLHLASGILHPIGHSASKFLLILRLIISIKGQSWYLSKNFRMNKIATWLSIISLVLVGLLYYFHFTHVDFSKLKFTSKPKDTTVANASHFKMAYFEMDSVDNNYEYVKFIREALRKKEADLNMQLNNLKTGYQRKIAEWQKKGSNISQAESEAMNREYQQMQVNFESRQKQLTDEYESEKYKMDVDANKRIAEFLKEYNKDKGFTYIMADQPNLIYYKDTVFNITQDVINGLNNLYKQDKKKN